MSRSKLIKNDAIKTTTFLLFLRNIFIFEIPASLPGQQYFDNPAWREVIKSYQPLVKVEFSPCDCNHVVPLCSQMETNQLNLEDWWITTPLVVVEIFFENKGVVLDCIY